MYNGVNALRVAAGAGDPNIKPETQTEIEGGFDASVFNGRASLSVTVFDKSIDDLIIQPTFAPSSGYTNRFTNGASLQNRGTRVDAAGHAGAVPPAASGTRR